MSRLKLGRLLGAPDYAAVAHAVLEPPRFDRRLEELSPMVGIANLAIIARIRAELAAKDALDIMTPLVHQDVDGSYDNEIAL